MLIRRASEDVESFEERFRLKGERDPQDAPDRVWDEFAGSNKSKVWGIFTHCQLDQQDVEDIVTDGKLVLLQVGEDGFNDEGVFTVLIRKEDLERRDFSRCECTWAQT